MRIVGSTRARLTVSSDRPVDEAVLFASLRIVSANGRQTLPQGLVAPIRIENLGPDPVTVDVVLPGIVTEAAAGDRLALVIATTDQGYRMPPGPAVYTVAAEGPLLLPTLQGTTASAGTPPWVWPLGAAIITALIWLVVALLRPRDRSGETRRVGGATSVGPARPELGRHRPWPAGHSPKPG